MKKFSAFGIIALSLVLLACNKFNWKSQIETEEPLSYFPAYPGSYWVYDNNETLRVADQYELYVFNTNGYTAEPKYDTLKLPKLLKNVFFNPLDNETYVKGYSLSKSNTANYKDPSFKFILHTTEDKEFSIGAAIQDRKITGKTIKTDTSIYIGNTFYQDVIVTVQFDYACVNHTNGSPEECATLREYYAKDVGLIKRELKNYNTNNQFVTDFELNSYFINN